MKVISVMNYKGGVGKTTVTANLAGELAFRGYNVLLIDVDPQTSLTFSFIKPDIWEKSFADSKTLKKWFDKIVNDDIIIPLDDFIFEPETVKKYLERKGRLSIISSDLGLINVDSELAAKSPGSGTFKQMKRSFLKNHQWLVKGLKTLEFNDSYDFVLIDCPPNFNTVTKNSIVASDYILIPAKPDYLSTLGIDYLCRNVNELVKELNENVQVDDSLYKEIKPEILGVIFTMVQTYAGKPIAALRQYINQTKRLDIPVFTAYIKENKTIFANAPEASYPITLKKTGLSELEEEVVQGIEEFTNEFIEKIFALP